MKRNKIAETVKAGVIQALANGIYMLAAAGGVYVLISTLDTQSWMYGRQALRVIAILMAASGVLGAMASRSMSKPVRRIGYVGIAVAGAALAVGLWKAVTAGFDTQLPLYNYRMIAAIAGLCLAYVMVSFDENEQGGKEHGEKQVQKKSVQTLKNEPGRVREKA